MNSWIDEYVSQPGTYTKLEYLAMMSNIDDLEFKDQIEIIYRFVLLHQNNPDMTPDYGQWYNIHHYKVFYTNTDNWEDAWLYILRVWKDFEYRGSNQTIKTARAILS